jgi:type I restriction enzyme R subunit
MLAGELQELREELEHLRSEAEAQRTAAERALTKAEEEAQARQCAEARARQEGEDRAFFERFALEADADKARLAQELEALQTQSAAAPSSVAQEWHKAATKASEGITLDEASTRLLIDQQLRDAGWEVDSEVLRFAKGVRPQKGKNMAIAEWPTSSGPADYVLFAGCQAVAVVEAKRKNKNVASVLKQAERYSQDIQAASEIQLPGPWGRFRVPFAFSTNARPYLAQVAELSGIWFRDLRRAENLRRPLQGWYTPDGLLAVLKQDLNEAHTQLKTESFDYGFSLRDYQIAAIQAAEKTLSEDRRSLLLAMATGTGKTKTAIALVYRLLKTRRFRRVLFLVDRNALGEQAAGAFKDTRMENLQTFSDIFGLKELGERDPDPDTKVQIATIQAMVKRVLFAEPGEDLPPVDQYDCILVDECHRGYLLDREMSDAELAFRDFDDYVSKYRRVLDHFDAVKIGLTATPALHTEQIFGAPVFRYSYREAVIDGQLVDHEPPIRVITALSQTGIQYAIGEPVEILRTRTNTIHTMATPDALDFDVDAFNRQVLTRDFNRVVCEYLATQIDPALPGKTLMFCVNDLHADIVAEEMKKALEAHYGEVEDAAVEKITGSVDRPTQRIRAYRNERHPCIVTTVDLLTTGIDVPEICNIVFLRRVNSRILFEQMLGRATRLCPEIGKGAFRVFDAVDQFANIQAFTDMKPVVVNPSRGFESLAQELARQLEPEGFNLVRDELQAKLRRRLQRFQEDDHTTFKDLAGQSAPAWLQQLHGLGPAESSAWIRTQAHLLAWLDHPRNAEEPYVVVSHHADELRDVVHGYKDGQRPEDFLEGFARFVRENLNAIPALLAVAQRPRDLTRRELKELRLLLDQQGYSETAIQTAWMEARNEDIAAGILGHIRRAALGDHLVPYETRVARALEHLMKSRPWTSPQRQWLDRIGKQLLKEVVVDHEALDHGSFHAQGGGFERLNKVFEGRLPQVLGDLQEAIWRPAS